MPTWGQDQHQEDCSSREDGFQQDQTCDEVRARHDISIFPLLHWIYILATILQYMARTTEKITKASSFLARKKNLESIWLKRNQFWF